MTVGGRGEWRVGVSHLGGMGPRLRGGFGVRGDSGYGVGVRAGDCYEAVGLSNSGK